MSSPCIRSKGYDRDRRLVAGARWTTTALTISDKTAGSKSTLCGNPASDSDLGRREGQTLAELQALPERMRPSWFTEVCPSCALRALEVGR